MNRAFLIILAPALLVAATFIAFGWGYRVSLRAGVIVLAVAAAAYLLRRAWQRKAA
jgi:hypothetical protein